MRLSRVKRHYAMGVQSARSGLHLVWLVCALHTATFLRQTSVSAQGSIPDATQCTSCLIQVQKIVSLGAVDGPESIPGIPSAVIVDARGRYWVTFGNELPLVFDSTGRFVTRVGRRGHGPGEFWSVTWAFAAADSVVLVDLGNNKLFVIAPDFAVTRSITLKHQLPVGQPINWPRQVIMNGGIVTTDKAGLPLHLVSLTGQDAIVTKSFSQTTGAMPPRNPFWWRQRMSLPVTGTVWTAEMSEYRITQWDADGGILQSFDRRPEWFSTRSAYGIGNPNSPPPPTISAIGANQDHVWVFASVAAEHWRDAWSKIPRDAREVTGGIQFDKLFRTRIEVIDVKTRRVVVTGALESLTLASLPHNRVASYTVDSDGIAWVDILRVTIRR